MLTCNPTSQMVLERRTVFEHRAYAVVEEADDMLKAHQKAKDREWRQLVSSAFAKGAGPAHRASKAGALEAHVMRTDSTQPYRLADREMDVWHEAWSCQSQDEQGTPADHAA